MHLKGNRKLWRTLSLLSLPWGLASIIGIGWLTSVVRPEGWVFDGRGVSPLAIIATVVGGLVATVVVTIVLHEAVHGILMWTLTRARPVFGFKGWYAYADAPGWFFQRWPMIAVLVAPLIVMPAIGLPLMAVTPSEISIFIPLGLIINSIAAVSDIYMVGLALRIRGPVYFGDAPGAKPGEAGSWYLPAS